MMAKRYTTEEDEFMADYKEWVQHRNNPYRWLGSISNFTLRAWRNRPRIKRKDGIKWILISIFLLGLVGGIGWGIHDSGEDWSILPGLILFLILGLLILIRGVTVVLGKASDMKDK